ncbi:MAG: pitrilysin family protein [Legionellaceae bacterium]|nr:pitrilysin family protein [Legionellaceae bacterium]
MKIIISVLLTILSFSSFGNSLSIERWLTSRGAHVVFHSAEGPEMLDILVAFQAGSAYDNTSPGLSYLTTSLLNQGNAGHNVSTVAKQLAQQGGQYEYDVKRDMVVLHLRTLSQEPMLSETLKVFKTILTQPDFPLAAEEKQKKQQIAMLLQMEDSPDALATTKFFKTLYPQHPYGHSLEGDPASIQAISHQAILDFYRRYFVNKNAIVVLVGKISKAQSQHIAEDLMQALPKGEAAATIPIANPLPATQQQQIRYTSTQNNIRLGQVGIAPNNPDYFSLLVGNYILGGGSLRSLLNLVLREKNGLTYGAFSEWIPLLGRGPFMISFSTQKPQQAIPLLQETLQKFISAGPSATELLAAQHYLTGSFPLSIAGNSNMAQLLLRMTFYHLPDDFLENYVSHIQQVTVPSIQQAFQKNLPAHAWLLLSLGPS